MRNLHRTTTVRKQRGSTLLRLAAFFCGLSISNGCASVPLVAGAEREDTGGAARKRGSPRCQGYVLLVENQLSRPVEIYEVGLLSDRLVTVALHGITEVQIADHTQQYVAVSQGEVMAASASNVRRPSDRVALERNCRAFF
ncbi:MAG: hypothetical protein M3Y64_10070 [Gemmatimonadota bacterium]|nr:hypothetical protein [Gemmatimonadota bacterium]